MSELIDINDICKLFNTTSRTLRFYEEKGIIESTKDKFSNRRKYNQKQIQQIRNVFVLRTLGLSVKTIKSMQEYDFDLKTAVLTRKAEIYASIDTKTKEIDILNQAIAILESGNDLFNSPIGHDNTYCVADFHKNIVIDSVNGILNNDFSILKKHLSNKMLEYMPEEIFWKIWEDTTCVCGKFISLGKLSVDNHNKNIIYQYINYEKFGLKIRFVFYGNLINGLWLNYYEV